MQAAIARSQDSPPIRSTVDCLKQCIAKDGDAFVALCNKRFGIATDTARTWIGDAAVTPKAINMLYVQTLLVEQGYKLAELERLPEVLQRTRVFVAEGHISIGDIQQLWNMENRSSVWRILSGDRSTSTTKLGQLEQYLTERFGAHRAEKPRLQQSVRAQHLSRDVEASTHAIEHGVRKPAVGRQEILDSAAQLTKALAPLIEAIASDTFTKEERTYFRSLLGEGFAQTMRLHFAKLVNEKTRELILEKQRTGEA